MPPEKEDALLRTARSFVYRFILEAEAIFRRVGLTSSFWSAP